MARVIGATVLVEQGQETFVQEHYANRQEYRNLVHNSDGQMSITCKDSSFAAYLCSIINRFAPAQIGGKHAA